MHMTALPPSQKPHQIPDKSFLNLFSLLRSKPTIFCYFLCWFRGRWQFSEILGILFLHSSLPFFRFSCALFSILLCFGFFSWMNVGAHAVHWNAIWELLKFHAVMRISFNYQSVIHTDMSVEKKEPKTYDNVGDFFFLSSFCALSNKTNL